MRCDFAEELLKEEGSTLDYDYKLYESDNIIIHHTKIKKCQNELKMQIGDYLSLEFTDFNNHLDKVIAHSLNKLYPLKQSSKVLVVGLGNEDIISDCLGSKVIKKCSDDYPKHEVVFLIPNVYGLTHIDPLDIIQGVLKQFQADIVLIIDALATSRLERLYQVIQVNNVGIIPGSGLHQGCKKIDETSLNTKIICIGVASVISLGAILQQFSCNIDDNDLDMQLTLSLQNIDLIIPKISEVIALGISAYLKSV